MAKGERESERVGECVCVRERENFNLNSFLFYNDYK